MTDLSDAFHGLLALVIMGALLTVYLLPTVVAFRRRTELRGIVFFLNIVVGWTLLGWLACMMLAGLGAVDPAARDRRQATPGGRTPCCRRQSSSATETARGGYSCWSPGRSEMRRHPPARRGLPWRAWTASACCSSSVSLSAPRAVLR